MTALERIELLTNTHHTVADWHRALRVKAAERTDLDIALIGHFEGPQAEAAALAGRKKALEPPPAPAPAPAPATASPSRPVTQRILEKGMEAFAQMLDDKVRAALGKRDQQIADLQSRLQQTEGALADLHAKNAVLEMETAAGKAAQEAVYRGY